MVGTGVNHGCQVAVADDRDGTIHMPASRFPLLRSVPDFSSLPLLSRNGAARRRYSPENATAAPEHAPEEAKATRNDEIILLPKAAAPGRRRGPEDGVEIVLDKAYASVVIEGPGQVRQLIRDPGYKGEILRNRCGIAPKPVNFLWYFSGKR